MRFNKHIFRVFCPVLCWFLLVMASACRVGKPYSRPYLSLPDSFRFASASLDSGNLALRSWKDYFTDTTLLTLIDSGMHRNYDVKIALQNVSAALASLKQARLTQLPTANIQPAINSTIPSLNSLNGLSTNQFLGTSHVEDFNASLNLSWEADIWGKIRWGKEAAVNDYLQTDEVRKMVQTQVVAAIAEGYYNLLALDAQRDIAQKNVLLNDSTIRIIRLQYDAGQVTALAIEQAVAQRQAAALLVPQLELSISLQEDALRILTGQAPAAVQRQADLNHSFIAAPLLTGVPADMLGLRPDVKASERALIAANARVGVSQASLYPSFVITASGGLDAFKLSNWFSIPASLFGMATGSLTQPIFQHRQLKTQFELAKINREKMVIQFRQSVLVALGEVSDALVKVQKLKEENTIAASRAQTLKLATRNAGMLFQSGMANYLEVITAQANSLQSELELADIRKQQLDAMVDLYRSLGGGWK